MATIRPNNRFGRRSIRLHELQHNVVDPDLSSHAIDEGLLQFFEKHELLAPVQRINMPPEIVRKLHQLRHPGNNGIDSIEPDGPRLDAAVQLMNAINLNPWSQVATTEERIHVLDAIAPTHAPFILAKYDAASFKPWKSLRQTLRSIAGCSLFQQPRTCTLLLSLLAGLLDRSAAAFRPPRVLPA